MAFRVMKNDGDEKVYVSMKLSELIKMKAIKYSVFAVSDTLFQIKYLDCVVATATIEADRTVVFQASKTELGQVFQHEIYEADPTVWWKVIYHEKDRFAFCGTGGGKATKLEALQELTKEQFLAGARLVTFKNGSIWRGVLNTLSSFLIKGEWPKCYVDEKDWGGVGYIV